MDDVGDNAPNLKLHTFSNGDPGYPSSTEVEIDTIEFDDDKGEWADFLAENEKPAEWVGLPKEAKDWILEKFESQICDAIADDFFENS